MFTQKSYKLQPKNNCPENKVTENLQLVGYKCEALTKPLSTPPPRATNLWEVSKIDIDNVKERLRSQIDEKQLSQFALTQNESKSKLIKDSQLSLSSNSQSFLVHENALSTRPSKSKADFCTLTSLRDDAYDSYSFQGAYKYFDSPPPQLPTEEMSLKCKMEMFYNKSEENFSSGVDLEGNEDYDLSEEEIYADTKSQIEKPVEDGISESLSKEDLNGSLSESSVKDSVPSGSLSRSKNGLMSLKESTKIMNKEKEDISPPSETNTTKKSCSSLDSGMPNPNFKNFEENETHASIKGPSSAFEFCPFKTFAGNLDKDEEATQRESNTSDQHKSEYEGNNSSFETCSSSSRSLSVENLQEDIDRRIQEATSTGHLDMANMGLPFFPSAIISADLSMVTRLSLQDNHLTYLPGPALDQLVLLKWFDLRFNELKCLPPEIGDMVGLEVLLLQGNRLDHLPVKIGKLHKLKTLQVSNNPLVFPPKHVIKGGLQSIMKFLSVKVKNHGSSNMQTPEEIPLLPARSTNESNGSKEENVVATEIEFQTLEKDETASGTHLPPSLESASLHLDNEINSKKNASKNSPKTDSCLLSLEECQCPNPDLMLTDDIQGQTTSGNEADSLISEDHFKPELSSLQNLYTKRFSKRLRDKPQLKSNAGTPRKPSLHLILQHPGEERICIRCKRKYIKRLKQEESTESIKPCPIPVVEIELPEGCANEPEEVLRNKEKKKRSYLKSTKPTRHLFRARLITEKNVVQKASEERQRAMEAQQTKKEFLQRQRIRFETELKLWREKVRIQQLRMAEKYSNGEIGCPILRPPFGLEEEETTSKNCFDLPPFSKLNERQRRLSAIEADIQDCLRRLDSPSGWSANQTTENLTRSTPHSRNDLSIDHSMTSRKKKMHKSDRTQLTKETDDVIKELYALRHQIWKLKLNSFV